MNRLRNETGAVTVTLTADDFKSQTRTSSPFDHVESDESRLKGRVQQVVPYSRRIDVSPKYSSIPLAVDDVIPFECVATVRNAVSADPFVDFFPPLRHQSSNLRNNWHEFETFRFVLFCH